MKYCLAVLILLGLSVSGFAQLQCTAFPCTIASVSLTDQTVPVSATPLVTPTTSGLFRVTFYFESSAIQGSVWGLSFKYTDDLATRSTAVWQAHPGQWANFAYVFRDVAGQPITYTVAQLKSGAGANYDLFITVEQLQ